MVETWQNGKSPIDTREIVMRDSSSSQMEVLNMLLEFVRFTNEFRSILRTVWYRGKDGERRETNGEHVSQFLLFA